MASDLGFPTQAYVYLAPSRAHGSPAHYDTHEVFALQVEGSKAWKVWGDVKRLPMRVSANEYDTQLVQQYARDHEPVLEVLLKPGDVLYIPRGFVHAAQAGDEGSVHVSIGVMVYRWIDVIQSVVEAALRKCSQDVHYKESLPLGRPPGAPLDASAAATLDLLTTSFVSDLALQEGLTILRAEFGDYLKPPLRHRLTDTLALAGVTTNARIPMRPDFAFNNGSRS
jgi:ribosomal protein L16 Arg81 hydroxylase